MALIRPLNGRVWEARSASLTVVETAAAQVATVSWDLVKIASLDPGSPYQRVELEDGKVGFIASDKLRSLIDYRLTASSRNGRWRIISFVAGD